MPSATATDRGATSPSRHGRADYDQAVDDFMRDLEIENNGTNVPNPPQEPQKDIDEEVQVKKKRKPNPKLDEARLLSHNGIPKLRRLTKSKLRFRGKGYEYADISTLLNMYQLWLDDLYPKAKFKDGLAMVEKVGHSKRMQITRRAWLDDTKPHRREESPERVGDVQMSGGLGTAEIDPGSAEGADNEAVEMLGNTNGQRESQPENEVNGGADAPEEDELDALLNEYAGAGAESGIQKQRPTKGPFEEESDLEGDELDALMAQQDDTGTIRASDQHDGSKQAIVRRGNDGDDFADDEEAMASMGW